MDAHKSSHHPFFILFAGLMMALSACQPVAVTAGTQPTQPDVQPSTTPVMLARLTPSGTPGDIHLDYSAVAQNVTVETVAAVSASADGPWWEAAPQYRRLTLQGYPVTKHQLKAQIFVYPAAELASANENAKKIASDLQAVLQTQQAGDVLPFLPLTNAKQAMHAQVQYLDFKSGKGVRYLTQFNQGLTPINNDELIYTFQGLTSDGKFYIAAVLPVTHPELPAGSDFSDAQGQAGSDGMLKVVTMLNQQSAGSFAPDLNKLDALVRSIEIQ